MSPDSLPSLNSTRVIELTPAGRAAVAVVLVAGPDASSAVDQCVHRADARRPSDFPIGRILVGRWGSPQGEELVVCRRSDVEVEIHCHGGVAAVCAVIAQLAALGCVPTRWQDWLREVATPIRAAAQIALAEAPTARTAAVLLDQYDGALASALDAVLMATTSHDWTSAVSILEAVISHRGVGLHLIRPWRVVIAGRPNVGKSSLLNSLVGFQRAIVCDLPGTTRDVVTAATAIDGWPVMLTDTAGFRETADEIESAGVELATAAVAGADLIVLVDDADSTGDDMPPTQASILRVLNKIDLAATAAARDQHRYDLATSTVTGAGIAELVAAIGKRLVPTPPPSGAAVPFLAAQVARLELALAAARQQDAAAVARSLLALVR